MKKITLFLLLAFIMVPLVMAETDDAEETEEVELTEEYQQDLIERLNHLHGGGPVPQSLENLERPLCGTSTALEYYLNQDRIDSRYKLSLTQQTARHDYLPYTYDSPAGHFKIHYETDEASSDAVYMPTLDTIPTGGDGVPDYINKLAEIADSVWAFEVDHLGFPPPVGDVSAGGDELYDLYIINLGTSFYGATYPDIQIDNQTLTSYIELDNDYDFYPYNEFEGDPRDFDRRLDAVRVTVAHEFQHSIHFTMDFGEFEGTLSNPRLYWWEMSAVWMEEAMYDDINDYYGYIPAYMNSPWKSLRFFSSVLPLFPYGAAIFPMYLTERFGDSTVTRKIWQRCRDLGEGFDFPEALELTIDEISGGSHDIVDVFREFSIWNVFTGERAAQAPAGYGYSEGEFFAEIPDSSTYYVDEFPIILLRDSVNYYIGEKRPEALGANYIDVYNLSLVSNSFDLRFFVVPDDFTDWNLSMVGFPLDGVSEATVIENRFVGPGGETYNLPGYRQLLHLYVIPTPVSMHFTETNYNSKYDYSFWVNDTLDPGDTVYHFSHPFPNPANMNSGDGEVTFRVETPAFDLNPGVLDIQIFNIAGEKIRQINYDDWGGVSLNATWDLKNESGAEVAAGVYLAFIRFTFNDGRPEITRKYKLAVFK